MRSRALFEYEKRWSSPPQNAPFTKGGGSAQALAGDCHIIAAQAADGGLPYQEAIS